MLTGTSLFSYARNHMSTHRFLLCGFQKLHYSCLPLLNWGQIYVIVIRWAGSGQQTFFFRLSHGGPSDNWYLKTILDVGFSHIERKNFVTPTAEDFMHGHFVHPKYSVLHYHQLMMVLLSWYPSSDQSFPFVDNCFSIICTFFTMC